MCCKSPVDEQQATAYKKNVRRDYGEVVSIDVSFRFIKEFLEARMVLEQGPISVGNEDTDKKNLELYNKRVKPFLDHMSEIIDSL